MEPAADPAVDRHKLEPGMLWIIAFKLFLGVLYLIVAVGVFGLLRLVLHQNLDVLADHLVTLFNVDPDNDILNTLLDKIAGISPRTLGLIGGGTFLYGMLELTEGVGLFFRKRWAEWLVVVATALFIPVEIREIAHGLLHGATLSSTLLKLGVFVINVAIIAYLIHSKDLLPSSESASTR